MADNTEVAAADSLSVEDFITRGNAIDAGQTPPEIPEPAPVEAAAEPAVDAEVAPEPEAVETEPVERNADGTFKKAKPFSIQKRISMAVAAQREAERQRDELAAKLAAAEAPKATPPSAVPETPAPVTASDRRRYLSMPDAPKEADYDGSDGKTYSDYTADMAAFIATKTFEENFEKATTVQQAKMFAHWETEEHLKRVRAAVKADPSLEQKFSVLRKTMPNIPDEMHASIRRHELSVDILVYLADHIDNSQRLLALPPREQAEELGRIKGLVESAKAAARSGPAPAPVISAAKALIKPVSTSPQVGDDDVDEGDLPVEEFIRLGNKKDPALNPSARRY